MTRAIPLLAALLLAPAAQAAVPGIQAHRGGPVLAGVPSFPEESLAAFRNAAQQLHAVLELDTKLTKDNVPVVFHDDTLDRTTNCEGLVQDRTLAELAECKGDVLGAPGNDLMTAPAPEPQPIATLAEVLAFARKAGIGINLEIKNYPTDDDYDSTSAFANTVMDVVLASKIPAKQVIIQGFLPLNLEVAEQRMPDAAIAALALASLEDTALNYADAKNWEWVSPSWPVDQDFVDDAHSRDIKVVPYTINQEADVKTAAKIGVDAIISDDALMVLRTLDTKAPVAKIQWGTKKIAKVRRSGKIPLRVSLDEPGDVALTAKLGGKVVAKGDLSFRDAGKRRTRLELNRRGRRALAKKEQANLIVEARSTDLALNQGFTRSLAQLR